MAVTWNMYDATVPEELDLPFLHATSHILIIGTQETGPKWLPYLHAKLDANYTLLTTSTLQVIQMSVWLRKDVSRIISHGLQVNVDRVATGVGNVLGNKGAIAVSLRTSPLMSLLVVNAHLTPHQHHVAERNADVKRIM